MTNSGSKPEYKKLMLTGRCVNGRESDRGTVVHAVVGGSYGTALCGKKPGPRSNGFSIYEEDEVTCHKCLKALTK